MMRHRRTLAVATALLVLAAALRFYRLDHQSFWNDEGNSARLSERSIDLIIEGTASDIHPPLYYLALRGWRELAGETEFSLRAFSAYLGVGVVALTYLLGRRLLGPSGTAPALVAAGLAAVNPALIYYSQEVRMYEMLAFLALLSTLLLVVWLQRRTEGWNLAAAYVLATAAGLYTHYFVPAALVLHNWIYLWWLFRRWRDRSRFPTRPLLRWLAMMAAVFLLYLPWLPVFLRQAGGREPVRPPLVDFLVDAGRWLAFGPTADPQAAPWPLLAYGPLLLVGLLAAQRRGWRRFAFPVIAALSLVIPLLLLWLAGTAAPVFYKFGLMAAPPLALIAGAGWWWGRFPAGDRLGGAACWVPPAVLGGLVLWGTVQSLANMYFDPAYARADYRGMAALIAAEAHPNAGVILNAANQWEVFTYYHREGAPVYPIPTAYPDPAAIAAELSDIAGRHDRLYALFWGESLRDPQRLVERWLDDHAFKAREEWVGDVRFVTYALPAEPAAEMEKAVGLTFGDDIVLEGYTLQSDHLAPGDIVQLSLFWRALRDLEKRYKVFLHLVDENGEIVAQRDSEPGGGLALTTTWTPGLTLTDNHGVLVPAGTPPGTYTLMLGLYDFADPAERLPIFAEDGPIDALPLAPIEVGD